MDGSNGHVPPNYHFDFDSIVPVEIPFTYKGVNYVLVEATEDAATLYKNSKARQTKVSPETRMVTLGDVADSEPYLVSLCLFKVDGDKRTPVSLATIRSWPHKVTKRLFETALEISGLKDEDGGDEAELDKQIAELQRKKAEREAAKNG